MKRIIALVVAGLPFSVYAHPCPYDWNITFPEPVTIAGKNMADFAKHFNDAVRKQTNEKIQNAIIYTEKADSVSKVPSDSPFSKEMDSLIQRYSEVTVPLIKKGVFEYDGVPRDIDFPANFPVACVLSAPSRGAVMHEETKEGLKISIHRELECRAYHVNAKFLDTVSEWKREDRIPSGAPAVPYIFALFSEMMWAFHTPPDPATGAVDDVEESILAGVTLYLPEKRVILAIDTKVKHEEITKSMQKKHYLENPNPRGAGKNPQPPNKL